MTSRFVFTALYLFGGSSVGAGLGLASGLIWIEAMQTSCFEGYCGYVALIHALVGMAAGLLVASEFERRIRRWLW